MDDLSLSEQVAKLAALGDGPTDNVVDPAAAMVKLFKKMDLEDMVTLNWIIKGRAQVLLEREKNGNNEHKQSD